MKHRYARWISALAAVVATAGAGCGDGDNPLAAGTTTSTNGMGTTAGTTAFPAEGSTAGTTAGTTAGVPAGTTAGVPAGTTAGTTAGATGGLPAGTTTGTTAGTTAGTTGADAGVTTGGAVDGGTTGMMSSGSCTPVSSEDDLSEIGSHTPTLVEGVGPSGSSTVYFPEDLGENGPAPVFMWGPGALTKPDKYEEYLLRLASHGFVVISQESALGEEVESLDWLLGENENSSSQFYQKLDPTRVGMGGHSLGSLGTLSSAADPRLTAYVLVCGGCMSGQGGCGAADIHAPTVILGGVDDTATPNFDGDYAEITAPVSFLIKDGTDHIYCARENLKPWVSFLRWQWCGEVERAPEFMSGGEFCSSPWECQSKNW